MPGAEDTWGWRDERTGVLEQLLMGDVAQARASAQEAAEAREAAASHAVRAETQEAAGKAQAAEAVAEAEATARAAMDRTLEEAVAAAVAAREAELTEAHEGEVEEREGTRVGRTEAEDAVALLRLTVKLVYLIPKKTELRDKWGRKVCLPDRIRAIQAAHTFVRLVEKLVDLETDNLGARLLCSPSVLHRA